MNTITLNLAPADDSQRAAMIQAGLLNADGSPRPLVVDLSSSGGVFDTGGKRLLAPIAPDDVN